MTAPNGASSNDSSEALGWPFDLANQHDLAGRSELQRTGFVIGFLGPACDVCVILALEPSNPAKNAPAIRPS